MSPRERTGVWNGVLAATLAGMFEWPAALVALAPLALSWIFLVWLPFYAPDTKSESTN